MHYGDNEHIYKARLEIVVYKHEDLTDKYAKDPYVLDICSIQDCKYMDMYLIVNLWDEFDTVFKKQIKKLKYERFYVVEIRLKKLRKNTKLYWHKSYEVSSDMLNDDPLLGVH